MSLLSYEFNKVFIKQKALIFIFLLICIKVCSLFLINEYATEMTNQVEKYYNKYLVNLGGKLTTQKEKFIINEEKK